MGLLIPSSHFAQGPKTLNVNGGTEHGPEDIAGFSQATVIVLKQVFFVPKGWQMGREWQILQSSASSLGVSWDCLALTK